MPAPNTIVQWLIAAGPYAVTLIVLIWLWLERKERLAAQEDARKLRDAHLADTREGVKAMGEFGEAMRERLRQHDERINLVLAEVERRRGGR